ncbi:unnamed protein product [Eruca vesicaria subsp. sativa]|uniref:Pectinesterase inhibitor domain-containing protein n=1 Tax=Eruca vesicaria subsp. sativa TaxID=29727 RepID=A0ABC8L9C3_ERUVS|nr:unnamed protein product [Eruca vesicaria subsp. sativa]
MSRILLIFLAITLACSVAEANTLQTFDAICKQTIDKSFCSGILAKATSPSMKDLLKVTVTEAEIRSADTYSFIFSMILINGGSEASLKKCLEIYTIVNASFTNAVSLFNYEQYAEIIPHMDEVSYAVGICKTDFKVPGYNINPMIKKNKETNVLAAMEKIIGHMLSS